MERLKKREDNRPISLRAFYKKKLDRLSAKEKKNKSRKINQFLSRLPFLKKALSKNDSYIAFYKALKHEPCLFETYSQFKSKACFPVIQGEKLEFYSNPENLWKKGSFQIEEPLKTEKNKIPLNKISVFFIPGACFDRRGFRFGKGFGYYDKTLSQVNKPSWNEPPLTGPLFIGVAFLEQIQNSPLPIQAHDTKMDFIATDEFVLCLLNKKTPLKKITGGGDKKTTAF